MWCILLAVGAAVVGIGLIGGGINHLVSENQSHETGEIIN